MLFSFFILNKSFAIISNQTELPPDLLAAFTKHQNAICRLLVYDEKMKILSSCTASLIETNLAISGGHCMHKDNKNKKVELLCGYQPDSSQVSFVVGSETGNKTTYNQKLFRFRRIISSYEIPNEYMENGNPNYDIVKLTLSEPIILDQAEYLSTQSENDYVQHIYNNTKPTQCLLAGYGADADRLIGNFHYSQAKIYQLNRNQLFEIGQFIPLDDSDETLKLQSQFDQIEQAKKEIPKSWPQYDKMIDIANSKSMFMLANYAQQLPTPMSIATPGDSGSGLLCLNENTGNLEIVAILRNVISNLQEVKNQNQAKKTKIIILGNEAAPFFHIQKIQPNVQNLLQSKMRKTILLEPNEE